MCVTNLLPKNVQGRTFLNDAIHGRIDDEICDPPRRAEVLTRNDVFQKNDT